MTCFIKDIRSYSILFETLRAFGAFSGLKVKKDKTEALALGKSGSLSEGYLVMGNLCDIIKILGVYMVVTLKNEELSFWKTLESIKKTINLWKWRGLSLIGRIQIVKTFAIPKLMFRASAISISKDLVKEAESIFYHFIWNGKDKVKRNAVISEVENGGLNMLDTESMIRTKRVICLQKFLDDYESPWKMFLGELLKPIGGKFLLHCNFEVSKLNISLPAFYRQCPVVAWSELNAREPSSVHEIVNQVIWNNKFLCVDNKSVYRRDIADQGFCKIWDLFSVDNLQLNPEQSFFIMSVINSMPAAWRLLIRTANIAPVLSPLPNTPAIFDK